MDLNESVAPAPGRPPFAHESSPVDAADLVEIFRQPLPPEPRSVGEILRDKGVLTQAQVDGMAEHALSSVDQARWTVDRLGVPEETAWHACARSLGMLFVDPSRFSIDKAAIDAIPVDVAREHHLIPLCFVGSGLIVAVTDPGNHRVGEVLTLVADHPVELVLASRDRIERAITDWYGPGDDRDVLDQVGGSARLQDTGSGAEVDAAKLARDKPVVRLVHNLLIDAVQQRASDVHLRPLEDRVDLFFRIDGALVKMRSFQKSALPAVVGRIKIIGNMDISEHRLPQDGRLRIVREGNEIDFRISVIPTVQGESVVIRILDARAGLMSLGQLGFNEDDAERFAELMTRTAGMVLVTGPTGCGKSTTLYAALQEVRRGGVNIVTVEDPVEYRLSGINQIQVNNATGLTFARALRHILRHDPDVVMVGEIRDLETAKMAVESSLTGHLVLSTLHTNDAASAVTRLLEIGIEPYLVNTSLMAVLAQRLVRRNCGGCIEREPVDPRVRQTLGVSEDEVFFRGQGCDRCHGTGYQGRRAVYELLMVTDDLRELITAGASSSRIERCAEAEGMRPLTQNALDLARKADTSLAEVYRVRLS